MEWKKRENLDYIKEILKGMLIGIANVAPGVSGSTLAISMGVYEHVLSAINHFSVDMKRSMKTLLPYGIGAIFGVLILSFFLEYFFVNYQLETNMIFLGLIMGGIPSTIKLVGVEKGKKKGMLIMVVTFLCVLLFSQLNGPSRSGVVLDYNLITFLKLIGIGVLAAITMIVPGISGSMLLMMMGYYQPILSTINQFSESVVTMDIAGILAYGALLLPLLIGFFIGVGVCARVIGYLFVKYQRNMYWGVIGLILSSPVVILSEMMWGQTPVWRVILSFGLFLLAYEFVIFLGKRACV